MQNTRRSSRNHSSCITSPNIFRPNQGDSLLLQTIPESILQKIGKSSTISCGFIAQLPPFTMIEEEDQQLRKCIRAMQHQLNWHSQLLQPQFQMEKQTGVQEKQQSEQEMEMMEAEESPQEKKQEREVQEAGSMWDDRYFVERLNDFLAAGPAEHREPFPVQDFFEK